MRSVPRAKGTSRTLCRIAETASKDRGYPRYWCTAHRASATGKFGVKLIECEVAYLQPPSTAPLELQKEDFPGGIGLWGAVPPVYDTAQVAPDRGIHVHTRKKSGGRKTIDQTFSEVLLSLRTKSSESKTIRITAKAAVSYYVSSFFGRQLTTIFCTRCGAAHLDSEQFALKPHRRHLCHNCLHLFVDTEKSISNPILQLQTLYGDSQNNRKLKRAAQNLEINQAAMAGGIQIWASNKAVLWTSKKAELEGIHVHAYPRPGAKPAYDETYNRVTVDGLELNEESLKYYMAQTALQYLNRKIVALDCPQCGCVHFDQNDNAFVPHVFHCCESCGTTFMAHGRRKKVISNPFIKTLLVLKKNHSALNHAR